MQNRELKTVRDVISAFGRVPDVARFLGLSEEGIYMMLNRDRIDPKYYFRIIDALPPGVGVDRSLFRRGEVKERETA